MSDIKIVLTERKQTHGDYASVAATYYELLKALGDTSRLSPIQLMSIQMICHKLARIANGDPNFADHWRDCCGYSQLALNELL